MSSNSHVSSETESSSDPSKVGGIVPHLLFKSATDAIEFYKRAFDAKEQMMLKEPHGDRVLHACVSIGDQFVFLADEFEEYCDGASTNPLALGGSPVTLHQNVADCDAAFQKAVDAGATPRMPPADMFWGDRYAAVVDPFGHCWAFATHIKDLSPEEITAAMKDSFSQGQQG